MPKLALALIMLLSEVEDRETLRFVHSAEQGYDSSCGLSALVCLLETYWEIPADELSLAEEFLAEKLLVGDYTVSFADMSAILKSRGFVVAAYKMSYEQLEAAVSRYAPLIAHYDEPEGHFVLVLSADSGGPVVANPASGTEALDRGSFEQRWSGYVLLAAIPGGSPRADLIEEAVSLAAGRRALLERASGLLAAENPR